MSASPIALAKPKDGEFDPASGGYIAVAPAIDDAVGQLTTQRDAISRTRASVPAEKAGYRYAPGKWSVSQVAGHLADAAARRTAGM